VDQDNPALYRLIAIKRKLRDLLMSKRLSLDPENTGVVEMADFGKRCEALAVYAAKSIEEVPSVATVAEDLELAARLAALMETLPRSRERVDKQLRPIEEVAQVVEGAMKAGAVPREEPVMVSLAALANAEKDLFGPFVKFAGEIRESTQGMARRGELRRALRRALLDHYQEEEEGPFSLEVADGILRFGEMAVGVEVVGGELERSANEPREVAQVLDMRDGTDDCALRSFLLVKAVDEALFAVISPRLATPALAEQARTLPVRPGKRRVVRPEAVTRAVAGWDVAEAARLAEKLAARRLGPDAARLPKGAYLLRLFVSNSDGQASDLLRLSTALRRMEKGEEVEDTDTVALRALRGLLGMLG